MTDKHPITLPHDLIDKWGREAFSADNPYLGYVKAAQWGANQELEACVEWLAKYRSKLHSMDLRHVRRPEPPSLRKQALAAVEQLAKGYYGDPDNVEVVRKALEALPND